MNCVHRVFAQKLRLTHATLRTPCIFNSVESSSDSALTQVRANSNRASIVRINRLQYLRHYPVVVVNPDGSTFNIRYHEPRKIVKLPIDISTLSEEDRKIYLLRRKPKTRVTLEDDAEDVSFDAQKYLKLVK